MDAVLTRPSISKKKKEILKAFQSISPQTTGLKSVTLEHKGFFEYTSLLPQCTSHCDPRWIFLSCTKCLCIGFKKKEKRSKFNSYVSEKVKAAMPQSAPMKCHMKHRLNWRAGAKVESNLSLPCVSSVLPVRRGCPPSCCMPTWKGQENCNNVKNEASEEDEGR